MHNKKGLTLVELLISIVLVGIVIVFIFELLNDLKTEADNTDYALANQFNHIEIVNAIENDLNHYTLFDIVEKSNSNNNNFLNLEFVFWNIDSTNSEKVIATLTTYKNENDKYFVEYTNYDQETTTWEMKDAIIDPVEEFSYRKDSNSNSIYFRFFILICF